MQATMYAIRAIGAEFVRRTLWPIVIVVAIAAVTLHLLGGWLITLDAWWWLLEALFILWTVIIVVILSVVWTVVRMADVPQTKEQKRAVRSYVDKLQRVSENLQTPQFIIIYRVVRDTIWPRQSGFIKSIADDSKSLSSDFTALVRLFR